MIPKRVSRHRGAPSSALPHPPHPAAKPQVSGTVTKARLLSWRPPVVPSTDVTPVVIQGFWSEAFIQQFPNCRLVVRRVTDEREEQHHASLSPYSNGTVLTSEAFTVQGDELLRLYYALDFLGEYTDSVEQIEKRVTSLGFGLREEVPLVAELVAVDQERSFARDLHELTTSKGLFFASRGYVQTLDGCRVLFHPAGLQTIRSGSLDLFFRAPVLRLIDKMLQLRLWMFETLSPAQRDAALVVGSVAICALGVRVPRDLDIFFDGDQLSAASAARLKAALVAHAGPDGKRLSGIEVISRGISSPDPERIGHPDYETYFLRTVPQRAGAGDMATVFKNPAFHFYWWGLRMASLSVEVARRVERKRPASYADLIAIAYTARLRSLVSVEIPPVPLRYWNGSSWEDLREEDLIDFYIRVKFYLQSRHGISLTSDQVREIIEHNRFDGRVQAVG